MNASTFVEPTPDQLARIATFEARTRAVVLEVVGISEEIIALRQAGLETREAAEAVADVSADVLDELRTLRVSRGIPAFSDWWFHRVCVLGGLDSMVSLEEIDATDEDADFWRGKRQAALEVDRAIAAADPELISLLDRADGLGHKDVSMQLVAVIGMTRAELEDRAEVVLTTLIESGWRP